MKRIAYINPDCYVDVDFSVLKHLASRYQVSWYPVYYTDRPIYYNAEAMQAYAREYGIDLHLCPRRYRQRDPRNLCFYREIVRDINARGTDIVYTCITEELYWTIAARRLKATRVLGLHDVVMHHFGNPLKRFIQTCIRTFTIHRFRNVCVFSENQRALFEKRYGRKAFELGLCSRNFSSGAARPDSLSSGVKLLFFGNIVEYKGLDLLIEALERARNEGITNLTLTVAGQGDFWSECERHIQTPQMYNLQVRFIENEEIPGLVASHHFMILPYRNATQSGPLMIASGSGMPVVAPRFGCFTEHYDDKSAVLYDDLDAALRRIAAMTDDEYARMRDHAALLGRLFSEEAIVARYFHYFDSL